MYGIDRFHKGFEEVFSEIIGGIVGDAILFGFAYIIPQGYRTVYFIMLSLINIVAVYNITENFEYAGFFYSIGWFLGLVILSTAITLSFIEIIIYGLIPLAIFLYKFYKQTQHFFC